MDALIRAAPLSPSRLRLSETRASLPLPAPSDAVRQSIEEQRVNVLREEIEARLRAETKLQLQEQYQTERERARRDGLTEARSCAADELARFQQQLRVELAGALSALERAHEELLRRLEASVGEVAFAAVCHFVGRHVACEDFVRALVGQACAQLRAETATARLHPRDVALLGQFLEGDVFRVQSIGLKLEPDASLALGGCVVEAASGTFDGGLENQLRRLHAALSVPLRADVSDASIHAMSSQDVR
jgi:flagellar assembly protein FliH